MRSSSQPTTSTSPAGGHKPLGFHQGESAINTSTSTNNVLYFVTYEPNEDSDCIGWGPNMPHFFLTLADQQAFLEEQVDEEDDNPGVAHREDDGTIYKVECLFSTYYAGSVNTVTAGVSYHNA